MSGTFINIRTQRFKQLFVQLPEHVQELAKVQFERFRQNPAHPSLRLHQLHWNRRSSLLPNSWSVTVGMQYRVIFCIRGNVNVWYWIGTHADYDQLTGKK